MARITHALGTFVIAALLGLALPHVARAQSIVAWGNNFYGQCNVPARQGLAGAATSVGTGCGGAGMPSLSCNPRGSDRT